MSLLRTKSQNHVLGSPLLFSSLISETNKDKAESPPTEAEGAKYFGLLAGILFCLSGGLIVFVDILSLVKAATSRRGTRNR